MTEATRGQLEIVLSTLYGAPLREKDRQIWISPGGLRSELWGRSHWDRPDLSRHQTLQAVYGDFAGGSLLGGSLKLSQLEGATSLANYTIAELSDVESVRAAQSLDPGVVYFMDAANIWFFGLKGSHVFSYDVETNELEDEGPVNLALTRLLRDWEASHGTETTRDHPDRG